MADLSDRLITGNYRSVNGRIILSMYNQVTGRSVDGSFSGMAWVNDKGPRGIVIFDNYTGSNVNVHLWGAHGAVSRKKIKEVYRYVFEYLCCNRLTGIFPASDKNLLQLIDRFGFVYEYTMRDYFGTPGTPENGVVYYISRPQALEWIK